jgi:nucleoside 2-deoxyribosyltransferase
MKKLKIYVGCSLTQATEEFRNAIETMKNQLREKYEILDFIGLMNGTEKDVFEWDTKCVKTCDLFVADCTYPATGLGYELGVAIETNKPILSVAHKDAKISRILLGVTNPNYTFKRYDDVLDIVGFIEEKVKEIN